MTRLLDNVILARKERKVKRDALLVIHQRESHSLGIGEGTRHVVKRLVGTLFVLVKIHGHDAVVTRAYDEPIKKAIFSQRWQASLHIAGKKPLESDISSMGRRQLIGQYFDVQNPSIFDWRNIPRGSYDFVLLLDTGIPR